MFEQLTREKVYETIEVDKKVKVEEILRNNQIDFVVRKENANHRNPLDAMKMGEMMISSKYVYTFWVKKQDVSIVYPLIKHI